MNLLIQAIKAPTNALATLQKLPFSKSWLFLLLVGLGTIYSNSFQNTSFEENLFLSPFTTFIVGIILAIPAIMLVTAIGALILNLCVKMVGGKCTLKDIREASYISLTPYAVMLPIYLIWSFVSPNTFFIDVGGASGILGAVIEVIASLWSFFVLLFTLSAVASISKWRAFLSVLLSLVALIVIFTFIGIIAVLFI